MTINMNNALFIDFETRSPVDLKKHGLARYAQDSETQALCLAWALGDTEIGLFDSLWVSTVGQGSPVLQHVASGGIVVAHNAQFELAIWNEIMAKRFGWPALKPEQTRCTMAACYAMGLPGALENAAQALGLKRVKDIEGRNLMLKMCKPQPNGAYYEPPGALARLGEYCRQDVAVEREIFKRVLPLSGQEQQLWALDQRINLRGIPFDMPSIDAAIKVADREKERLDKQMGEITGGAVRTCSAVAALKDWANDYGVIQESLSKIIVSDLLEDHDAREETTFPASVRAALETRREAGRFTSISKLSAISNRMVGGRVAYTFQYHAAATGRWAGRGIQPHNFTRDLPIPADVEDILRLIREGNIRWLDMLYGPPSIMISKCLRGFILAGADRAFLGGDFANVEGRGIAWLAGEEWKLAAFRECDADSELPDMYERAYAKSFGIDPRTVTKEQRQVGKVEELAFGYQGGVGAFHTMSKTLGVEKSDAEAEKLKRAWRTAHPRIVAYWAALGRAAIAAVRDSGAVSTVGAPGRQIKFRKRGSFLWCRLPSGRNLCYPYPEIRIGDFGEFLSYKSVPDQTVWSRFQKEKTEERPNTTYIVDEPGNTKDWCRIATYGGKLSENITQAICRDLLAEAITRVEAAGYKVVLHVHDEVIVEGKFVEADRLRFEKLITTVPIWAKDFPITAHCWLAKRYRKE